MILSEGMYIEASNTFEMQGIDYQTYGNEGKGCDVAVVSAAELNIKDTKHVL